MWRVAVHKFITKGLLKKSLFPFLAVLLVFLAPQLAAPLHDPASAHFKVGERLTYALKWGVISAGKQNGHVSGLTTAASIWSTAAIGLAAGLGHFVLAVGATVLQLVVLRVVARLERGAVSGKQ